MYIESLKIRKNGEYGEGIRQINFRKGTNLIIDKSSTEGNTQTGNNVGKTTVLRLIDYCLGGKKERIYQDPEFKVNRNASDNKIKNFLENENVCTELILNTKDTKKSITIKRNFLNRSQKIQTINNEPIKDQDFSARLGQLILNHNAQNPTFRQIICRNIRHSSDSLNKTLKPLHQTVKNTEYEALYLYWIGIASNSSKIKIEREFKLEQAYYKKVEEEQHGNLSALKQKITIYENQISELEIKKDQFNLNKNYAKDLEKLNNVKQSLNSLKTQISSLETRKILILESQQELDKTSPNIEQEKIKYLYNEARKLIPNLQKKFEDIILFHNSMIEEKKEFIGSELPEINSQLKQFSNEVKNLLQEEERLSNKLKKTGAMDELETIIQELTKNYEDKGRLEKVKDILETSGGKIKDWEAELNKINEELEKRVSLIEDKIVSFNKYFSRISRTLYDQPFFLSHEFDKEKNFKLKISSLSDNPGTGGKRVEIVAFDLAYIQFAQEHDIPHLNFVLHDQIENIHDNQISTVLLNIVNGIDCQYIISVLQDKLPSDINVENYSVLTLSQDDKLFKIK